MFLATVACYLNCLFKSGLGVPIPSAGNISIRFFSRSCLGKYNWHGYKKSSQLKHTHIYRV